MPRMARSAHDSPRMGYLVAAGMLVLAGLFPVGLMVFNPTLMFERGWEQYVGTAIYLWAVLTLGRSSGRSPPWDASFCGCGGTRRRSRMRQGCSSTSAAC